ncbi:MAG TPA: Na+/H+ antiporter subunit E [Paracoccus sp. (in: a-proteobacteria)]|nr:Na+/H+ antiporter subunit E [Paracoccus sp. (in: a-proteobacteria)]
MRELARNWMLVAGLTFTWLLLAGFSTGNLILGLAVGWGATVAAGQLDLPRSPVRNWWALIRLIGIVAVDIVKSNIGVAGIILAGPGVASERSGFLELTMTLRNPNALAVLAIIITATPGTAWLEYHPATGRLLLHVLDLRDPEAWGRIIHGHYEALLKEAFE